MWQNSCLWGHAWGKWEQYTEHCFYFKYPDKTTERTMQKRRCERCNYEQRQEVCGY